MRSLSIVMLACGVSSAQPRKPAPTPFTVDTRGWCPRTPTPRSSATRTFDLGYDLKTVRELRRVGGPSEPVAWPRGGYSRGLHTWLHPTIENGELRLSTPPWSCEFTDAGCIHGHQERPAEVKLVDPVKKDACISYSFGVTSGMVVALGKEWRMYDRGQADETLSKGTTVVVPAMEAIDEVDGKVVLQEAGGKLWIARDGKPAPTLSAGPTLAGRVTHLSYPTHGYIYAFTDVALYLLDKDTLAVKLKIDGDVWAVTNQDVPLHHFVLSIEHGGKPRVMLRELDDTGKVLRELVVHKGPATAARLSGSNNKWIVDLVP